MVLSLALMVLAIILMFVLGSEPGLSVFSSLTCKLCCTSYLSLPKAGLTGMCHHHIQLDLLELASTQPKLPSFIQIVFGWSLGGLHFTRQHDTSIKKVLEDLDYIP